MGIFLLGAVVAFLISMIIFVFSEGQKRDRKIKKIREKLENVTIDDINIYETNRFADVKSLTGDGYTFVEYLDTNKIHEEDGFLYIDEHEFNKDKIISIEYYDVGKAELKLSNETIYFHRVMYYDNGNINSLHTRYFIKEYGEKVVIEVNDDNTLTVMFYSNKY